MTQEEFRMYCDDYAGYCKKCDDVTREDTEPDAEGYECPQCNQETCCGMDIALLMGHITFDAGDDEGGELYDDSF